MAVVRLPRFWEWGRKIVCVGRNYVDHAKELNNPLPSEPVLFLKPPSSYLREGHPIEIPWYSHNLHHEVELGLVLGQGGRCIPTADAMDFVGGYALCLDMTARDTQDTCKQKGLPWTLAKAFDGSCPIGDFIPKQKIPEPQNLRVWLKVNGALRQDGNTSDMIFSIPSLINYISNIMTLEEGDLILTGRSRPVKKHFKPQTNPGQIATLSQDTRLQVARIWNMVQGVGASAGRWDLRLNMLLMDCARVDLSVAPSAKHQDCNL